jgi:anhydro-N-acetylmuramic acid kinase
MTKELYIGLMSGTSMDGIDAALVEINSAACRILHTHFVPWPDDLLKQLQQIVMQSDRATLSATGPLHHKLGCLFANAALGLLDAAGQSPESVTAIGSHGQTILHEPDHPAPHSVQLGDPGTIAVKTGIPVVADFRNGDMALGGQGAPLTPAFHRWAFGREGEDQAVVNIGGIANVTILHADGQTTGFDTGPGNTLLNQWISTHQGLPYDDAGDWAAGGNVNGELLSLLSSDDYFSRPPPKSTGLEYFNLKWLQKYLDSLPALPDPRDVQSTLSELTAVQIANALRTLPSLQIIAVCGGGAANTDLMNRLQENLPKTRVQTTVDWGIDPQWVEAAAFAWLARQRMHGLASNLQSVTGASAGLSLGGIYLPPIINPDTNN